MDVHGKKCLLLCIHSAMNSDVYCMTLSQLGSKNPFIISCQRDIASYQISHPIGPVTREFLCGNLIIDGFLI